MAVLLCLVAFAKLGTKVNFHAYLLSQDDTLIVFLEQAAERKRKEAASSGEHAGPVKDTEEQRKVIYSSISSQLAKFKFCTA